MQSLHHSVSEEIIRGHSLQSSATVTTINNSWTLCSLDCAVTGFQLLQMPSHAVRPGALTGIYPAMAARVTSTGRLLDPPLCKLQQALSFPAAGAHTKARCILLWGAHGNSNPERRSYKRHLALKEFNWPWIMKYLLSAFQVKYSGNLWVASDLCDSWMKQKQNWSNKTSMNKVAKMVKCKYTC